MTKFGVARRLVNLLLVAGFVWGAVANVRSGNALLAFLAGLALGAMAASYVVEFALWKIRRRPQAEEG